MFKPKNAFSRGAGTKSRTPSTVRCQKCLEYGHYSYECNASERPYKARPTRTQMLKNPQLLPKLSIDEEPNKLLEKTGIADKVLADKELEREKRRRSESVSTYSSSGSVSTYSSDNEEEEEEGGDRKRVRRNSPSRSPSSYSSSYSSSESGSESPRGRTRERRTRSVSSGSVDSRSTSRGNERQGQPLRRGTPPTLRSPSPMKPERDISGRRRSPSPDNPPPKPTRSRWDQRGRSPPPRRERSLSPYSKRKFLAGQ